MIQQPSPWRLVVPENDRGEVLCFRVVPVYIGGVALGWREEYAFFRNGVMVRKVDKG